MGAYGIVRHGMNIGYTEPQNTAKLTEMKNPTEWFYKQTATFFFYFDEKTWQLSSPVVAISILHFVN